MQRPTLAQLSIGTFTVVGATIALLAVSGTTGMGGIVVLVAFAIALGTLTTALLMVSAAHRRPTRSAGSQAAAQSRTRPAADTKAAPTARQPEYARPV